MTTTVQMQHLLRCRGAVTLVLVRLPVGGNKQQQTSSAL